MLGAMYGDIAGSVYEMAPVKRKDLPLFLPESTYTDDTVLSAAVMEHFLGGRPYGELFREYCARYPGRGYGAGFSRWAACPEAPPYHSMGNGSAMRVSPVAWACRTLPEVLEEARESARVTHDHPEGIRGAQTVAGAVFLARTGHSRREIRIWVKQEMGYDLSFTLDGIRPDYRFDATCPGSVPPALVAFLESSGFEDAVRGAISLGGDADTQAAIAGALAEAAFGMTREQTDAVLSRLDDRLASVVRSFYSRCCGRPEL